MSKGLKIVLVVVLLVVLGVVAFATLGGENLLGRMKMFSPPKENQSEKPMLPASNEKKSVRVPSPKPVEDAVPFGSEAVRQKAEDDFAAVQWVDGDEVKQGQADA